MSSYDQNLLDEAPKATRAQLQEGYNVDLLEQPPRRTSTARRSPPLTSQTPPVTVPLLAPGIPDASSREKFGSPPTSTPSAPRKPFWRTRNGIIIIVVAALVVVGAVVGGAVGGTVTKNSGNDSVGTKSNSTVPSGPSITLVSSHSTSTSASTSTSTSPNPSESASTSSGQNTGPGGLTNANLTEIS